MRRTCFTRRWEGTAVRSISSKSSGWSTCITATLSISRSLVAPYAAVLIGKSSGERAQPAHRWHVARRIGMQEYRATAEAAECVRKLHAQQELQHELRLACTSLAGNLSDPAVVDAAGEAAIEMRTAE
eukprot:CAMPEP_0181243000 /NCGR_PEP_ID=MMETSP1096-20121128/42008_1 /TAXON_ID=156174 ORGANISM="Chrysochromulina ericina, Strain CCMP281" /NCGR_SAMPLE_ID=MMETSP1096 /ASSEMBLY_ACC=CAM_ASM_000453 /LENGTH=127 /DNA_ID=CAMNT_0023339283 /DNA_START=2139 /DNA_END=2518 /DNA_ORIENTATION=-